MGRRTMPSRKRAAILCKMQDGHCAGCGKPLNMGIQRDNHPDYVTVDHVTPRVMGGAGGWGNIVAMHRLCNNIKGNDRPTGCEIIWLAAVNVRLNAVGARMWN